MKLSSFFLAVFVSIHISCSVQTLHCRDMKYLSLSKVDKNGQHIDILYNKTSNDLLFHDDRILFRKSNLNKSSKIQALEEYFCFYKDETISDKIYSQKYGRIQNRIKLIKENIKFSVEVEALYSLTTFFFEDNVAISPVIVNRNTGRVCNFQRKDMDEVYKIYRVWFRKMKRERFSNVEWPLKKTSICG